MTSHLENRVSALLDGQLSAEESERDWAHVYACHTCRDLVEREGWVKSRLARLSQPTLGDCGAAPDRLKGALAGMTPGDVLAAMGTSIGGGVMGQPTRGRTARAAGFAALGGGAVGAAVVGVLALGAAPADAPVTTNIQRPASTTTTTPPTAPSVPRSPVSLGPTSGPISVVRR